MKSLNVSRPPQNVKLGIFIFHSCNDAKKNVQISVILYTCKIVGLVL